MSAATKARPSIPRRPPAARGRHRSGGSSVAESWRSQPWSLRVLRAFLGLTFVYAGLNKFLDPNFLHAGSYDFIGRQLRAFAEGSPIGGSLRVLDQNPVFVGIATALSEIGIGIATLVGIAPMLMAAGGFGINLLLWLSATWHVHPYFMGSDSIYAIAWLAYGLGLVEIWRRRQMATVGRGRPAEPGEIGRREFLRGGALAGASLLLAALASAFKGQPTAAPTVSATATRAPVAAGTQTSTGGTTGSGTTAGTPIANLSQVPVGDAIGFDAPGIGPAALVRLGQDKVVSYSRVCTHAGCLVGYDPSSRILVCPCHGAQFDPSQGAAVIAGPAPSPLQPVRVEIDQQTGQVVLPT